MKLSKALNIEVIHNKEFAIGSIILELDNKLVLVSTDFHHTRKRPIKMWAWLPDERKWVKAYLKNQYTEIMWNYYRKHQKHPDKKRVNYEAFMHHDRVHKHGGGGSRIYDGSITDYECTKNPLHDFRRCYN